MEERTSKFCASFVLHIIWNLFRKFVRIFRDTLVEIHLLSVILRTL